MCRSEPLQTAKLAPEPTTKNAASTPTRDELIDKLNDRVARITAKKVAESKNSDKPLAPEFVHAQRPLTPLIAGAPVYQKRFAFTVYAYSAISIGMICYGVTQLHPLVAMASLFFSYIGYDLYSGFLHVILDNPDNISKPLLGQACLEFQWHHAIPDDLVRKSFVDVCGDLNTIVTILMVFNLMFLDMSCPVAFLMAGGKMFMAYVGQFSHKSAHQMRPPKLGQFMQDYGLMISTKEHWAHHQDPYDRDFCLIGLCNPIIDFLRRITTNNAVWIISSVLLSAFDMVMYSAFVRFVMEPWL